MKRDNRIKINIIELFVFAFLMVMVGIFIEKNICFTEKELMLEELAIKTIIKSEGHQ